MNKGGYYLDFLLLLSVDNSLLLCSPIFLPQAKAFGKWKLSEQFQTPPFLKTILLAPDKGGKAGFILRNHKIQGKVESVSALVTFLQDCPTARFYFVVVFPPFILLL